MIGGPMVATAAAKTALIDSATLNPSVPATSSLEYQDLTAMGFTVTVVDDPTWASMTPAQFGAYDLLVIGDPNCGPMAPGVVSSAPSYGSVVLGRAGGRTMAGNRIVIGTDPVFHDGTGIAGAGVLIKDGLAYAGGGPAGTTGLYFDVSCSTFYDGDGPVLSILPQISQGMGAWTVNGQRDPTGPPCGGSVSLIASNPAFSDLTTADLQGWSCSVHESFPTFTSDFSPLAIATDTSSHPVCGQDTTTHAQECGEPYILVAGAGIVVQSGDISLTPTSATNPAGTDHTVTAHVTIGGSPASGQTVTFTVTGQNAGATGTCNPVGCVTDSSGNVSFTYHDSNGPGTDTIKASFTDPTGSLQSATASKTWTAGDTTPPTCVLTGVIAGPPKQIQITVQDTGSGLGSVVVTSSSNDTVAVPPFTPGTTSPVVVTATKINQTQGATVALQVTDVAGNVTKCDPALIGLRHHKVAAQRVRVRHLSQAESNITIVNGHPGIHRILIAVNGRVVKSVVLRSGQNKTVSVAGAMKAGDGNTIALTMMGKAGGGATVAIHD